jgi:hypothetical protein
MNEKDARLVNENVKSLLSSSSGSGMGPFLSAVKRPSHGSGTNGTGSSFFLMLYYAEKRESWVGD